MRVMIDGVDIYPAVSVGSCIHDMYAAGQSDSVTIKFNDPDNLWGKWRPEAGQTIRIEEGSATTGDMFIKSIVPENGSYSLRAFSCPATGFNRTSKAWERVTLHQIAAEIAERNNLSLQLYGVENQSYNYLRQDMQSDYAFLHERLQLESCAFLVFDGKLVVYSEPYLEGMEPTDTLYVTPDILFEYKDNSGCAYQYAEIECGSFIGRYTDNHINNGRILRKRLFTQVGNGPEANRFAKGLLRQANKEQYIGTIHHNLLPGIAAGSVINIQTDSVPSHNGAVFVYQVRHDYVRKKTKLFFRKPLEGY